MMGIGTVIAGMGWEWRQWRWAWGHNYGTK